MNLFSLIPRNFFSPLSSENREIYEDRDFTPEAEYESPELPEADAGAGGLTPNIKARLILNRFIKTGWIDKEEMDDTFAKIITPRYYAIRVMRLLDELRDESVHYYNSPDVAG